MLYFVYLLCVLFFKLAVKIQNEYRLAIDLTVEIPRHHCSYNIVARLGLDVWGNQAGGADGANCTLGRSDGGSSGTEEGQVC